MAVPLYDASKHNIGLGGYGFMLANYNKRQQEQPIEKVRVGTGDLVGNERLSFWTQDDYSGGEYQYEWGDPAMVARTDGILPNPFGKSVRTIPDLIGQAPVSSWPGMSLLFNNVPLAGFAYGTSAFFCFANGIVKITQLASGSATYDSVYDSLGSLYSFYLDRETNTIYAGSVDAKLYRFSTQTLDQIGGYIPNVTDKGTNISGAIGALGMFGDKLMAAFGRTLYMLTENEGLRESGSEGGGWDTSSVWVRTGSTDDPSAGVLPAKPVQMVPYNGQMYILCGNAYREGFVASSTGQDVITVCELPYAITPRCMAQYNGRLFIGGGGYDLSQNEHYGELHELSGTSLRLVRTFKREADTKRQRVQTIRWMDVQEGLLWFAGPSGYNLSCYDAATDAFFTGPSIPAGAVYGSPSPKVQMVLGYRNLLLAWVDHVDAANRGIYRTRIQATEHTTTEYSFVDTSDFGPEPARLKAWSEVAIETRYGGIGSCQASIDGGLNWINLPLAGVVTNGNVIVSRFTVTGTVAPSTRIRLRFSVAQLAFDQASELVSHTLSFLFLDSGKHGWQIAIPCAWNLEVEHLEPEAVMEGETAPPFERLNALWAWADARQPIAFIDRDQTTHQVILTQCVETEQVQNPKMTRETFFSTYLVEV